MSSSSHVMHLVKNVTIKQANSPHISLALESHNVYGPLPRNSPELRPDFPSIYSELQQPDFKLLTWTAEDVAAYTEEARTLGAPLEAGEQLYNYPNFLDTQY